MACAPWLEDYARFHARERGRPEAQHLVYTCRETMPVGPKGRLGHYPCLGVGDRFRLIAFMLRVAATFRRVLLVDWQSPVPLETFFSVASIDWRLTDVEREQLTQLPVQRWSSDLSEEPPHERYLRIFGNAQWFGKISVDGFNGSATLEPSYGCMWRLLFRPSQELSSLIEARRREMFGSASAPYNALHIRMGDAAHGVAFDASTVPQVPG